MQSLEVKKITYKKLEFYKNLTMNGGALKKCLEEVKDNKKIIHIHNEHYGRLWGITDEETILKLLKRNIGLYEVITTYPHKVYFDIDGDNKCNLEEIKELINKYFINAEMAISGYETEDKKSYHITLNNYIINNEEEKDKLKFIVKYLYSINSNFDWKVYTNNRNMKAINQSKIKKPIQEIIKDENYKNHLITCFINNNSYDINNILVETVEKETLNKLSYKNNIDWSEIEKQNLKLPENIDINKPLDLLNITPLNKDNNHAYTWRTARFCFYNGLTLNDFLKWYSQKSTEQKNINRWVSHWNLLNNHPEVSIKQYIYFLSNFYPDIIKNNNDFIELFNIKKDNIKYIETITQEEFKFKYFVEEELNFKSYKCKIFNIGMGGGKTTQTINYLKGLTENENFIWITPNISLAHNTFTRIKEQNINCNIYDSAKNKENKKELIEISKNIIICLNSLFYTNKFYDVVVIDEIETFLKLFNNNDIIKELDDIFKKFIDILINAKKIILLDAFISNITLNFIDSLNIDYEIIRRNKEESTRTAIIMKNFNNWIHDIINDLKDNKKLLIFYPFKNARHSQNLPSMKDLLKTIEHYTNKKGIFHNADSSDKTNKKLKDVNKNWIKYDFVISNNKINVGLNFDLVYFDSCYLSIAGFNSPRDIVQFSYRTRDLKSNVIKYCFLDNFNNIKCLKKEEVKYYNDIFQELNKNIMIEKMAELKPTFNFFLNMAKYKIINDLIYEELEPLKLIENDYYNYDKIEDHDICVIKEYEKDIYGQQAKTSQKLAVKKYYYKNLFKPETKEEILKDLWNNNKFQLINNIRHILSDNKIIKLLKNNYNWFCLYPDNIDKEFKFNDEDLKLIFDNYKFKNLSTKSKHHLILKSYINTLYGCEVVRSKKDSNKHHIFYIDETFKDYYICITNNIKPLINDNLDFID